MGAGLKAKSLRGECVSDAPGRGSGGQKIQNGEPGCFSESLGILPLPARDLWTRFHQLPSENKPGTVQRARLSAPWWNMATLHQQVAYFFNIRIHFVWTSSKHIPKAGYSQGLTTPYYIYIYIYILAGLTVTVAKAHRFFWYQLKCIEKS